MIYFLAGACVGSVTTFLAMAFVLIADDRKDTEAERTMSESEIKRANNCPNFMLTEDIITGREYAPREPKAIEDNSGQLKLF